METDKISHLEQLLTKLNFIVFRREDIDSEEEAYPRISMGTDEDGEYNGKPQILVGDDTLIRENDGKFYALNFHNEDADPIWMDEQEILDYYAGQDAAYNFPTLEDSSYHYIRGFKEVAKRLLDSLDESNNKMKIIK